MERSLRPSTHSTHIPWHRPSFFLFFKGEQEDKRSDDRLFFPVQYGFYGVSRPACCFRTLATAKASVIIAFMTPFNIIFTILVFRLFEKRRTK
jgi:hypothetical protein